MYVCEEFCVSWFCFISFSMLCSALCTCTFGKAWSEASREVDARWEWHRVQVSVCAITCACNVNTTGKAWEQFMCVYSYCDA